jgi:hypothetical protein
MNKNITDFEHFRRTANYLTAAQFFAGTIINGGWY